MANVLSGLKPQLVWEIFENILSHPHPSKKEEKLAAYILNFAAERSLETKRDKSGNIVIRKPATAGMENRKPVVIQGHIDMVCEKNSDVEFDFDNDPIQPWIDGDWVRAKGTTLGADNGIGVAMGMALLASHDIPHPGLELLCTLDEETGLTGAIQLETGMLNAEVLINLDSEEDGAFTIGCAGGQNTAASFKYQGAPIPADSVAFEIVLKGLKGGHSGIEIHDGRGNALKLMNRLLWDLTHKYNIRLSSFFGGNKHNAIPRECFATIVVAKAAESDVLDYINKYSEIMTSEWISKEPNILISSKATTMPARIMDVDFQKRFLNSMYSAPHGVIRMSPDIPGLVQTSTNLAILETRSDDMYVLTSQRSSVETEKYDIANMVRSCFELGGAEVTFGEGYPGWQPNVNSPILKVAINVFKDMYGKEPKIEAIHAGLECGLVGEKYPGMDMLSFGPNLKDVHSPDEKIQISTVDKCWNLLLSILLNIPERA
ncbi:MAG: Aminoacylhistidine dipeptidase [Ignavibacteria bacterium]|nr:Aminoacylhistidine dipeptidase [Ignavibacteria bacterium]